MTLKSIIIWGSLFGILMIWQLWEEYKYGDDISVNIFSTGDYQRILK